MLPATATPVIRWHRDRPRGLIDRRSRLRHPTLTRGWAAPFCRRLSLESNGRLSLVGTKAGLVELV